MTELRRAHWTPRHPCINALFRHVTFQPCFLETFVDEAWRPGLACNSRMRRRSQLYWDCQFTAVNWPPLPQRPLRSESETGQGAAYRSGPTARPGGDHPASHCAGGTDLTLQRFRRRRSKDRSRGRWDHVPESSRVYRGKLTDLRHGRGGTSHLRLVDSASDSSAAVVIDGKSCCCRGRSRICSIRGPALHP